MIKEKIIHVKISSANYSKYYDKYGPFNNKDVIEIDINDLTKKSAVIITAICNKCNIENNIKYYNYTLQIERGGYYCCHKCSLHKNKTTNLEKYGYEHHFQNKNILQKSINTIIEKYGTTNISKLEFIKNKKSQTTKKNHGVEFSFQSEILREKSKNTWLSKYGVDNPSKSEEIKSKKENTLMKNHGVLNPSHCPEIFEKAQTTGKKIKLHECGLMYRGTYEKDFLDYCLINNILVEKGPTIEYIFNNKRKYYHSDFYIKSMNLICEIKSSYYYNKYLDLNLLKEASTIEKGYNFTFIIDKDYTKIKKRI